MKRPLFLILVFLSFITVVFSNTEKGNQDCNKIEVEVESTNTSNGLDNGRVEVNMTKGDANSVKYIFCAEDGKVLNEEQFKNNILVGLKKGTYYCIVSTVDCYKKIRFTIE